MGVDGIDKADIFDEYFDDEKPKVTIFQRIKSMDIDEMANWFMNRYAVCELNKPCVECEYNGFCSSENKEDFKKWLLSTKN